jgi:2-hydroxy-6-oxonona-2,4-dienedioate hydrolase
MRLQTRPLESKYTLVDGVRIHTRAATYPDTEGRVPLILVHGLVVSSRYMIPVGQLLASRFPVYAIDMPGYGESESPGHVLELPELADSLCRWLDARGIERAAILGNSFGCQITAEFGMRFPERLASAILVGPTINPHARLLPIQMAKLLWTARLEGPGIIPTHKMDYQSAGIWRALRTIRIAMNDRIEDKLPHVTVPTLVVRGARDSIVPQYWAEEVTALLPRGQLVVVPRAAHILNYTNPLELARLTVAFLDP